MNLRTTAAALALGLGLSVVSLPSLAEEITPPEGSVPIVGMAPDPQTDGLWLAGPSADDGVILHSADGREVSFGGDPLSVQALAWSGDRLWIADIGDESAERESVVVFRLGSVAGGRTTYHAFDFEYDDGARDAKAMLISGRGRIYIVTAGDDPGIYRAALQPSRQELNTLTRVSDAPAGVTDGTFLSDGATMALRTATGIEYLDAFSWETLATDTIVGGPEDESIAVGPDDTVYVGGNPSIRVATVATSDVTTSLPPAPEPSDPAHSPAPRPEATGTQTASEAPAVSEPADSPARTGTVVALVLAGIVAVTAGGLTFLLKR